MQRLEASNENWEDEYSHVLWAYRKTPHSTTRETPLCVTFGTEAFISIEVKEISWKITHPLPEEDNNGALI